jgi:hypothetical protein
MSAACVNAIAASVATNVLGSNASHSASGGSGSFDETVVHYRRMWFNPRYGAVGLLGTPFDLATQVVAALFEVLAVVALALSVALGAGRS